MKHFAIIYLFAVCAALSCESQIGAMAGYEARILENQDRIAREQYHARDLFIPSAIRQHLATLSRNNNPAVCEQALNQIREFYIQQVPDLEKRAQEEQNADNKAMLRAEVLFASLMRQISSYEDFDRGAFLLSKRPEFKNISITYEIHLS